MEKRVFKITESVLKERIAEKIQKQSIFVNPDDIDDCGPLTYDYLFNRHKGLPTEYFEPTNIAYDPNEIAMYTIPSDVASKLDLNEGLINTWPT